MKAILFLSAAAVFAASTATAEIRPDDSRAVEDRVAAADAKVATADTAFQAGDTRQGCKALLGAAHELDRSIDISIHMIERANQYGEPLERHETVVVMQSRLQSIVDRRSDIQTELQDRCARSA
ncbi:hypothetical protein [Asticcacaulis solisilvae]|uniref:hypothetical protein n=1 Tax=Asticcacaulis solisilvae TaxID=1217274 RepID=UPI003FD7E8B0